MTFSQWLSQIGLSPYEAELLRNDIDRAGDSRHALGEDEAAAQAYAQAHAAANGAV